MKKYLSLIAIIAILLGGFSFAHASGISWANIRKPIDNTLGVLTSQTVDTVNGLEIEVDTYTNSSNITTQKTFTVSKAYYASDIAQAQAKITRLQAKIAKEQALSAQLIS